MNRDIFRSMRSQLTPDESLLRRTLQLAEEQDEPKTEDGENKQPQSPAFRRRGAGIAAAVLAIAVAVGVVLGIARLSRRETADPALSAADLSDSAQTPPASASNQQDFDRAISAAYQLEIGMPVSEAVELLSGVCENAPVYSTRPNDLLANMAFDFGGIRLLLLTSSDRLTAVEIQTIPDGMINSVMPLEFYDPEEWTFNLGIDDPMQWALIKWSQARQLKTRDEVRGELGQPNSTDGGSDIYEEYLRIDYTEEGEVKGFYISGIELPYWRELRENDVFVVSEEIDNERYSEYDTEDYQHIYDLNGVMDYLRYLTVGMPADEVQEIMAAACPDGPSETADSQEVYTINGYDVTLYFMDMLGSVPDSPLTSVTVKKHGGSEDVTAIMPLPSPKELYRMDRSDDYTDMLGAWYSVIDCRTKDSVRTLLGEPEVSKRTYDVYSFGNEKLMVRFAFESKVVGFMHYDPQLDYWFELSKRYTAEAPAQPDDTEPSGDNFPEMLKPYVGHRSSEYDTDFDRMMADVANLTAADRDVFFDDFESFGDPIGSGLLISSFYGAKNDGTVHSQTKYYRYGPYMLRIWGNVDEEPNEELPVKYGQLLVSVERWGNLDTGWVAPYVSLRIISEDGTDLPVESHTKEEIDELAYIIEDPKLLDQVQDRNESFGR